LKAILATVGVVLILAELGFWLSNGQRLARKIRGYQAVLPDNNQVYFGKIAKLGADYPVLTDVFYSRTS
jgi:hypothetical protein